MAAGLGFKTFTTGSVLSAADVNGYLMQGVLVFASAAARDAAITAPAEGQFAFTKDTNGLWFYDGAAWVASGAAGDIEGVTAGVGISGGGTSGTVTITNSMATAIDAKGDLVAGTGADTFARLPIGANNTILVADSTTATGMKWAAPAGGGKVLQVVNLSTFTNATNSTTTFADTPLTLNITPSSTGSKVMVMINVVEVFKSVANVNNCLKFRVMRDATQIGGSFYVNLTNSAMELTTPNQTFILLDSPSTTAATTYKLQFAQAIFSNSSVQTNFSGDSKSTSTITLMEIGA